MFGFASKNFVYKRKMARFSKTYVFKNGFTEAL